MDLEASFEPTVTVVTATNLTAQPQDHPFLNMEEQRARVMADRKAKHNEWCASYTKKAVFDHHSSRVRAQLLVDEAYRLEKMHLEHQIAHAKRLVACQKRNKTIGPLDKTPSPTRGAGRQRNPLSRADRNQLNASSPNARNTKDDQGQCVSTLVDQEPAAPACACIHAPLCRQITPKYRVMALIAHRFDADKLEETVESLRQTYASDDEMLNDILYRYGPEEEEDITPEFRLRNAEEKLRYLESKWRDIGNCVSEDMAEMDQFQTVIRNLSIMRIFLEGSQSPTYGCDTSARARRDAHHQEVLDKLSVTGELFFTPQRKR